LGGAPHIPLLAAFYYYTTHARAKARVILSFFHVFSQFSVGSSIQAARFGPQKSHAGFPRGGQHGFLSHFL
jgi:hypothetical protein